MNTTLSRMGVPLRRMLSLCLVLVMIMGVALPARATDDIFGEDMRILAIEGTVRISNKKGVNLSFREGMKVYNGYSIATGLGSCAYIQLDEDKVVLLGENTQVAISKRTRHLEMKLNMGELFFNVESPLQSTETFNIRTSTMVTGIRGTSGFVLHEKENGMERTTLGITDGHVAWEAAQGVVYIGQDAGDVFARQLGVFTRAGRGGAQSEMREMAAADLPDFAASAILASDTLLARVQAETGFTTEAISQRAEPWEARPEPDAAAPGAASQAEALAYHKAVTLSNKQKAAEPVAAPSAPPAQSEAPAAPAATPAPAQSESPAVSTSPEQSESPTVSTTPEQSESPTVSTTPEQSESPAVSTTPEQSESPAVSTMPEQSESPAVSTTPEQSESPAVTPSP